MQHEQRATVAVVLPGTGSDADFARRAFGPALSSADTRIIAVQPDPRRVVASYCDVLDDAAMRFGRILVGGISLGASVAVAWAGSHQASTVGVLAALPPWTGPPDGAPAALSAAFTARRLRADGLATVTAQMRAGSPTWLADALTRSWAAQWPDLPAALDEAAGYESPTVAELAAVAVPVGITGAVDDPVHPIAVAREWARLLPHARLRTVTLEEIGADPAVLGRECLTALG